MDFEIGDYVRAKPDSLVHEFDNWVGRVIGITSSGLILQIAPAPVRRGVALDAVFASCVEKVDDFEEWVRETREEHGIQSR